VLMKNWDPPELGAPVLAIEKVLQFEISSGKRERDEDGGERRGKEEGK
jgi:hypothetical protein